MTIIFELKPINAKTWAVLDAAGEEHGRGTKLAMTALLEKLNESTKKFFLMKPVPHAEFMALSPSFGSQQKCFDAAIECILALEPEQIPQVKALVENSGISLQQHMRAAWAFVLSGNVTQ